MWVKGGVETKRIGRGSGGTEGKFKSGDTRSGMGMGRGQRKRVGWGKSPDTRWEKGTREQSLGDTVE